MNNQERHKELRTFCESRERLSKELEQKLQAWQQRRNALQFFAKSSVAVL